jgi:hypothetical protein
MISIASAVVQLQRNAQTVNAQLSGVTSDQWRWRPSVEAWNMLEVICHLVDEEREDFRARLDRVLHRPDEPWTPIHPGVWVTERNYDARDPERMLLEFRQERARSIDWLHGLRNPVWSQASTAGVGRPETAGDLLAAWIAHDLLHIRQLNELHYARHAHLVQPYRIEYAGDWV